MINTILHGPALDQLKTLDSDSIDLIVTDPPYGYSFMNKDWDKAVVGVDTWKECLRVLKAGAFAFIMSSPRQDVLCKMILNLIDAGFETNFTSLYWCYASGFPKAADVSKLIDKRNGKPQRVEDLERYLSEAIKKVYGKHYKLAEEMGVDEALIRHWIGKSGTQWLIPPKRQYDILKEKLGLDNRFDKLIEWEEAEREIIEQKTKARSEGANFAMPTMGAQTKYIDIDYTKPATQQAKKLEGSYAGFQPKPAVEVILTVMKPLSEKTFVDQALSNGKGVTWLDDCRIPYQSEDQWKRPTMNDIRGNNYANSNISIRLEREADDKGRFPANLLVEDDVLNNGEITSGKRSLRRNNSTLGVITKDTTTTFGKGDVMGGYDDSGSFSHYFSLDSWTEKTLPFLIVPKASKGEKNKGLDDMEKRDMYYEDRTGNSLDCFSHHPNPVKHGAPRQNHHPTVKPLQLMSYLITMGSHQGDLILDPFCGSGTALIAARQLARNFIGIEISDEYVQIANTRLRPYLEQTRLL